jgi:thiamine kinase-like enzyme
MTKSFINIDNYIYLRNNFYISLDLNVPTVFLSLLKGAKPFDFLELPTSFKVVNVFGSPVIRMIRASQYTLMFYKKKKSLSNNPISTNLANKEYKGEYLIKLREGEFKIINLKEETVFTYFPFSIELPEIESRMSKIMKASTCKLAPKLVSWNIKGKYYVEEYINSKRPKYHFSEVNRLSSEVFSIIQDIMGVEETKIYNTYDYILEIYHRIDEALTFLSKDKKLKNEILEIYLFIKTIRFRLLDFEGPENLYMTLSHGDLWTGNMLMQKTRNRVIDWNTLDIRSCYFDFYYFMFMLASQSGHFDKVDGKGITTLANTINFYLTTFDSIVKKEVFSSSNSSEDVHIHNIYRYVFYLELIKLKITAGNMNKNSVREVLTWIKRFKYFENVYKKEY